MCRWRQREKRVWERWRGEGEGKLTRERVARGVEVVEEGQMVGVSVRVNIPHSVCQERERQREDKERERERELCWSRYHECL